MAFSQLVVTVPRGKAFFHALCFRFCCLCSVFGVAWSSQCFI